MPASFREAADGVSPVRQQQVLAGGPAPPRRRRPPPTKPPLCRPRRAWSQGRGGGGAPPGGGPPLDRAALCAERLPAAQPAPAPPASRRPRLRSLVGEAKPAGLHAAGQLGALLPSFRFGPAQEASFLGRVLGTSDWEEGMQGAEAYLASDLGDQSPGLEPGRSEGTSSFYTRPTGHLSCPRC